MPSGEYRSRRVPTWWIVTALWAVPLSLPAQEEYPDLVLDDGPIAYYRFEETEGEVFADSSDSALDSVASLNALPGAEGLVGGAVELAGNGNIELGVSFDPALADFSIELLFKPTTTVQQVMVAQLDGTGVGRSDVIVTANGTLGSFLGGGTTDSDTLPLADAWHHVVLTYDADGIDATIRVYINGVFAGSSLLVAESNEGAWLLGANKNRTSQFMNGLLDEVAFYDYRIDDPDEDGDTSDSVIPGHAAAAFGGTPPCNGLDVTCEVDGDSLVIDALSRPEGCDCGSVEIWVDDVLVTTEEFEGDERYTIDLPACEPDAVSTVRVACTLDGRAGTCEFVCPATECDVVDLAVEPDGDGNLDISYSPLPGACCETVDVLVDGTVIDSVAAPVDGRFSIPLPADCAPGTAHELSIACGGSSNTASFTCPIDAEAYETAVLDDEPLAFYQFEEEEGEGLLFDSSENALDSTDLLNVVQGVAGIARRGALFNGDANALLPLEMDPADPEGDGLGEGLNDFSVECWVKTSLDAVNQVFAAQQDGAGLGRSNCLVTGNGFWGSFLGGATTNSSVVPEPDRWYHYVLAYDGNLDGLDTIHIYVDGELVGTSALNAESATGGWVLGSHKLRDRQFFTGMLDEVAFYAYRLDDPDGDDDTADSRIPIHLEAAYGSAEPCDSVEISCEVTPEDTIRVQVTGAPEGCGCASVDLTIDEVPAGSASVIGGVAEIPLPPGCPPGEHTLEVTCSGTEISASCTFTCGGGEGLSFLRGDCNGDGRAVGQVTDAVFLLNFNFSGGPNPPCFAACDVNGDGAFAGAVTDAIFLLNFNFLGGPAPAPPFPDCGSSTRESDLALGCETETCP